MVSFAKHTDSLLANRAALETAGFQATGRLVLEHLGCDVHPQLKDLALSTTRQSPMWVSNRRFRRKARNSSLLVSCRSAVRLPTAVWTKTIRQNVSTGRPRPIGIRFLRQMQGHSNACPS